MSKDFCLRDVVRGVVLAMASLMWGGTRTQANDRSCVTQPPRISQARMSIYVGLWSLLGMRVEYGLGVEESMLRILGSGGSAGKVLAKLWDEDTRSRISAFGDTM